MRDPGTTLAYLAAAVVIAVSCVCAWSRSSAPAREEPGAPRFGRSAAQVRAETGPGRVEVEPPAAEPMENAAIHEVAYLEKYLTVLATIANIAPLLGFLGTVVGMILSFEIIAEQGLNDPGAVAKGISVALLTTAYGLIVAFVTQPFYNFFTSKVSSFTREIETASNILFETFDEMESSESRSAAV